MIQIYWIHCFNNFNLPIFKSMTRLPNNPIPAEVRPATLKLYEIYGSFSATGIVTLLLRLLTSVLGIITSFVAVVSL